MGKMADAVLSNSSTDIWRDVEKMKPKITMMSSTVDGNDDCESIANMFSDKYSMLYNSVPYDTEEMKRIESEILLRVQRCSDNNYCITVQDVMNAVTHLKLGKSDGLTVLGNYMHIYLICSHYFCVMVLAPTL